MMALHNPTTSFAFWSLFLHGILLYCLSILQPTSCIANTLRNETDRFALLKFKESISNDPRGVLSSWNESVHFCDWRGVSCSSRHQRLTALDLQGYNLRGTMSPFIGNLSFMRLISLGSNSFFGEIPQHVGRLFRLQHLNLSHNMFEGKIPVNLSYSSRLSILQLEANRLTGTVPRELGSLVKLVILVLHTNNLTGSIPPSLGNISSLEKFSIGNNNLVGNIPNEIGKLKRLYFIGLVSNNLSGTIPPSLFNISSISTISFAANHFRGTLPSDIGFKLPNLQRFGIAGNELSGTIPESFSNASQLQALDIPFNNFVGQVPTSLGDLRELSWLGLSNNSLGNYLPNSWDFIVSLSNCSKLKVLDLSMNMFGGVLPNSIANLSTSLIQLYLGGNLIYGNISEILENLVNLETLGIDENLFTGVIPTSLGKLQSLQRLWFDKNRLSGEIPRSIGNLTKIVTLNLFDNKLEGGIPTTIADCRNLQYLDISNNRLSGAIPQEIFGLPSLSVLLNLSHNSLVGSLPVEVGKLKNINTLDLSENNLTNEIPDAIADCESLEFLYLQGNFLRGAMPPALASLRGLRYLDLSRNNLSGQIPKEFEKLRGLQYLNLSFNDLEGEVPNKGIFQNTSAISVVGNTKLCGGIPELQLPRCHIKDSNQGSKTKRRKLTIILVCVAALFLPLSAFAIILWRGKSTMKLTSTPSTISFLSKVSYKMLYRATNGFSPSMLIGSGSFGSVYKGILVQEGELVAIKVLNLHQKGAVKSFIAECNALRNIRHRNLVKIVTCCSSLDYNGNEFKALVFEYMCNGSLEKWLHLVTDCENRSSRRFNIIQRLNVAIDVASAIYYLHENCDQPIIHCDLKPSNVLLDEEMIARVSDFGLARLLSTASDSSDSQTSTIGIKGTIGYVAPEYAMGGMPSKHGDVYSYGILVLEMFTGRRPTDEMFKDDFKLHNFVKTALPERLGQIMDSSLLPNAVEEITARREESNFNNNRVAEIDVEEGNIKIENPNRISADHLQKCLVSVLEIGVACSEESPNERMKMGDVVRELEHIRNAYVGVGIH